MIVGQDWFGLIKTRNPEMTVLEFILAIIASVIGSWLYQFLFEKRSTTTRETVPDWVVKSLESARVLLPNWYRRFIAKKYGLDFPGQFVVDRYMEGMASDTLMPGSPIFVSKANGNVLLEALRYSAGHPERIEHAYDFALRYTKYGVFRNREAADEFLSQVLAVGADRGVQMSIEQPVWSEMNEEQRRKVTIPRELIDEYLKNYGTGFIITRLGIFAAVFGLVLWLS